MKKSVVAMEMEQLLINYEKPISSSIVEILNSLIERILREQPSDLWDHHDL